LKILHKSDQLLPSLATPESQSAAVLHYLEQHSYDLIYAALDGGLMYYTLLAVETGVYVAPPIVVVAYAPEEWANQADKTFPSGTDKIAIAHMEKYCAEMAPRLICSSAALRKWMLAKGWKVRAAKAIPPLLPQYKLQEGSPTEAGSLSEIILLSGWRFREGLTLICDALDQLALTASPNLCITAFGPFGTILGEHSGGLLLRRAARWPFRLNLFPQGGFRKGLDYLARTGGLAVIPAYETSTGDWVSACLDAGIPFVATNVGANADLVSTEDRHRLVDPEAAKLARAILAALDRPASAGPASSIDQRKNAWLDTRALTARTVRKKTTKEPPLVSIVMAHRNRPHYLTQACAAIEQQTYHNIELVLVDDGSDLDEARRLLDVLEPTFRSRGWKILRRPHKHLGAARNAGVRASRGELILFVDDDNALLPEAVEVFVRAMAASKADICTAFQLIFYEEFIPEDRREGLIQYLPLGGSNDLGFLHNTFGDANAMVRRSVFSKIGYQIEKLGYSMHDWEFFARASLSGLKVRTIPKPLYWYRSKPDGMFRTSHWYDNRLPILSAYKARNFDGVELLYQLIMNQNVARSEVESARENLRYSVSDHRYLALCDLEPNSEAAMAALAAVAESSGRPSTAAILRREKRSSETKDSTAVIASEGNSSALSDSVLKTARLLTPRASTLPLLLIAPGGGGIFLRPHDEGPIAAALDWQFPSFARRIEAVVEVAHVEAPALDFGLALCRPDQVVNWAADIDAQTVSFSGWVPVEKKFSLHTLEVGVRARKKMPLSILLAIRFAQRSNGAPTNAFFRKLTVFWDA
jgi:glycosyltransferase involved in cell wall biosynthesis